MDTEDIRQLNVDLGRAEQVHDAQLLQERLHDKMVFRRASGKIVDKLQYLQDLTNTTYDVLESTDITLLDELDDVDVVTVNVTASGTTSEGTAFSGRFHNVRVFVKQDGRWQLLSWANTRTGDFGR